MHHTKCDAIQQEHLSQLPPNCMHFYRSQVDRDAVDLTLSSNTEQGTTEWLDLRKPLLTASNFSGAVGWSPFVESKASLVQKICYSSFKGSTASRYGNTMEPKACRQFEYEHREKVWKAIVRAKEEGKVSIEYGGKMHNIPQDILDLPLTQRAADRDLLYVRQSGLHIHPIYKWLGASPDGIIVLFGVDVGLLEIKCPYRNKYPYPLLPQYYYGQLLGGCFVMDYPFQYFYVWSETKTSCERFDYDPDTWLCDVFPRLAEFYFHHLLPELCKKEEKNRKKI